MAEIETALPSWLWAVRYDARVIPPGPDEPFGAANCQVFAYAVLRQFGREVPPLRSSDLWADAAGLPVMPPFEPLDLLFFNPTSDAYGAHLAVSLGGERALHLCKSVGLPAVWTLQQFAAEHRYRVLLGGRRFG